MKGLTCGVAFKSSDMPIESTVCPTAYHSAAFSFASFPSSSLREPAIFEAMLMVCMKSREVVRVGDAKL